MCFPGSFFLCWACRWFLCGMLTRAVLGGLWLITAVGINTRSQGLIRSCLTRNMWGPVPTWQTGGNLLLISLVGSVSFGPRLQTDTPREHSSCALCQPVWEQNVWVGRSSQTLKTSLCLTCFHNPTRSRSHPSLWGGREEPQPWKSELTTGQKQKGFDSFCCKRQWRDVVILCDPWQVQCWITFHSNAHMHTRCLVHTLEHSGRFLMFLWAPTSLFWPRGCCLGLHHLQIFFFFFLGKHSRGENLSDGWRLNWCVCRKSVNNINFIWMNRKAGSGNSHMSRDSLIRLINFWGVNKILIKVLKTGSHPIFFPTSHIFMKDVLNNSSFLMDLLRGGCGPVRTAGLPTVARTSLLYTSAELTQEPVDLCRFGGKTDTASGARSVSKAPRDHTPSLTSKTCPHGSS